MTSRSVVPLAALAVLLGVTGCESLDGTDEVGQSSKQVDASLSEHDADADAHENMTINAAQLTAGKLDEARLPDAVTGAIAKNTTDIASHSVLLNEHGTRLNSAEADVTDAFGRLDVAEAAIAERVARTGDTMTGTLQVPLLAYTTPKAKIVGVSPWAFSPEDQTTTWTGAVANGNGFRALTGGTLVAGAPVVFPDGARLTNMSIRVYDATATGYIRFKLRYFDGGDATDLADVGSTAADVGGYRTYSVPLNHIVTNTGEHLYFVSWTQNVNGNTSVGPGFYGVRFTYTYTQP